MTRARRLTNEQAQLAAIWYEDYERVGTFEEKARELHVDAQTLRDAIRRVRGEDTKGTRQKLSQAEIDELATLLSRQSA